MTTKRIEYIDIAKGIGIILVVIGHCINGSSFLGKWIWSFHMPLFFILSGMCFDSVRNPLFIPFAIKKIKSLLFPLVIFSILMTLMKLIIFPNEFNLSSLKNSFPDVAYWFIFILFLCELLFFNINKTTDNKIIKFILLFICIFIGKLLNVYDINLAFSISSIFVCTFFYGLGYMFKTKIYSTLNLLKPKYASIIISAILLLIPAVSVFYINDTIDLRLNKIPYPVLYHIMVSLMGFGGILLISKLLSTNNNYIKAIMLYVGKNTLIVLLLHMFFISLSVEFISPFITNKIIYKIIELSFIGIFLYLSMYLINSKMRWLIGKF